MHLYGFQPFQKCCMNMSKSMPLGVPTFSLLCIFKITMSVLLNHHFVDQKEFAKTPLEVLSVNVKGAILWILLD